MLALAFDRAFTHGARRGAPAAPARHTTTWVPRQSSRNRQARGAWSSHLSFVRYGYWAIRPMGGSRDFEDYSQARRTARAFTPTSNSSAKGDTVQDATFRVLRHTGGVISFGFGRKRHMRTFARVALGAVLTLTAAAPLAAEPFRANGLYAAAGVVDATGCTRAGVTVNRGAIGRVCVLFIDRCLLESAVRSVSRRGLGHSPGERRHSRDESSNGAHYAHHSRR
jgi:hypothetical protein